MTEEFERTYLAKRLPPDFSSNTESKEVLDTYLPASSDHPILRIRKLGERYEIKKNKPDS